MTTNKADATIVTEPVTVSLEELNAAGLRRLKSYILDLEEMEAAGLSDPCTDRRPQDYHLSNEEAF